MPFYHYIAGPFTSEDHQWKIHHAMYPDDQAVGDFFLPMGAGTFSVTGVGFQPDAVVFLSNLGGGLARFTFGCATSSASSEQWSHGCAMGSLASRFWKTDWQPGSCLCGVAGYVDDDPGTTILRASLQSFDSDGFTLNVTTQAHSTTMRIAYLALKGDFKAGVIQVQESIAGLGFEPTGLWFAGSKRTLAGMDSATDWCSGFGSKEGFDPAQTQQSLWSGNRRTHFTTFNHWQTTSRYSPGYIANWGIAQDLDNPASTFASYILLGRCQVSSWGSSNINLAWTDLFDTTPYQFGYLAMGVPCETGRWDFDWHAHDPGKIVNITGPNLSAGATGFMEDTLNPDEPPAMMGIAPITYGGSSGTFHTWALQSELARGFGANLTVAAHDRNLGRYATSTWGGDSSILPPAGNDPEPKSDEWYVGAGEAPGSASAFVGDSESVMGRNRSFAQPSMGGNGGQIDPYSVNFGRTVDLVHYTPSRRHLLPIEHVGP